MDGLVKTGDFCYPLLNRWF